MIKNIVPNNHNSRKRLRHSRLSITKSRSEQAHICFVTVQDSPLRFHRIFNGNARQIKLSCIFTRMSNSLCIFAPSALDTTVALKGDSSPGTTVSSALFCVTHPCSLAFSSTSILCPKSTIPLCTCHRSTDGGRGADVAWEPGLRLMPIFGREVPTSGV